MTALRVLRAGPRTTVQDGGRHHLGHVGVPAAGAVDRASMHAANVAVGNRPGAAVIESTLGGDELLAEDDLVVAVRGAPVDVGVDGEDVGGTGVVHLRAGQRLRLGRAIRGVYVYLAVAGGVAAEPVLGSRSSDTLAGIGPRPLAAGDVLPVGRDTDDASATPRLSTAWAGTEIPLFPGPHLDRLRGGALDAFLAADWTVSPAADRVALRLIGPMVDPGVAGIESEGLVPGAVQLPPDGQPVVFLANHPATGGYPVVGVVASYALSTLAQSRPGTVLRFTARLGQNG